MKGFSRIVGMACGLLVTAVAIDSLFSGQILSQKAVAIIGRPATPGSVAGATRRTTRRVIRRSSIYVATLPVGYTTVVIEGTNLFYYNGTYYQAYDDRYVVVYVD